MSLDSIQKAIDGYFTATQRMDAESWVQHFAADATSHDPVGGTPMKGHDQLRAFFAQVSGAFASVGLFPDTTFLVPGGAAVKWTGRGTGKNGRQVKFEGIDVFAFNADGKIQTLWAYWDPAAMFAELSK